MLHHLSPVAADEQTAGTAGTAGTLAGLMIQTVMERMSATFLLPRAVLDWADV